MNSIEHLNVNQVKKTVESINVLFGSGRSFAIFSIYIPKVNFDVILKKIISLNHCSEDLFL